MLKPLSQWYCDVCGKIITSPDEGYVVWETTNNKDHGFKIIHQEVCDDGKSNNATPIQEFLGFDGLIYLTSMLSLGEVKKQLGQPSTTIISDFDEFVDLIRRFQVPFYEEARRQFYNPALLSYYIDGNETTPYLQDSLQKTIAYINNVDS